VVLQIHLLTKRISCSLPTVKVVPPALCLFGVLAISAAPLKAGFLQAIAFGFSVGSNVWQIGEFNFQYKSGYEILDGSNHSIDWMTMTVGSTTGDLVRNGVVVTDHFGFSFHPASQKFEIGLSGSPYLGFAPGYLLHGVGPNAWDLREVKSNNIQESSAHSPINCVRVGDSRRVPDGATHSLILLGGVLGLGMTARWVRRKLWIVSGAKQV